MQPNAELFPLFDAARASGVSLGCAMIYAGVCGVIHVRSQGKEMSWGWAACGATAATLMLLFISTFGLSGPTVGYAYVAVLMFAPVGVAIAITATYLVIRKVGVPAVSLCTLYALVWAGLTLYAWLSPQ
jgi:drug/metabolite transporter (DMT)-like permease